MEKYRQLKTVKELYAKGENIIEHLKNAEGRRQNSVEDILISYDFQAGSYVKGFSNKRAFKDNYCSALAQIIDQYDGIESVMEVGVGEATTLGTVLKHLKERPKETLGFDISWSRLKFAKHLLRDLGVGDVQLFTANLFEIPLQDNSVDLVYTSHSIEPNGGREEDALKELYRVVTDYIVLLEPAYELAGEEARKRMENHGYITRLHETAQKLGYNVLEYRLFEFSANPLNPTGLMIIKKGGETKGSAKPVCPVTKSSLTPVDNFLFAADCGLAYPVLDGIPCLLKENAILANHLLTNYDDFKRKHNLVF